MGVSAPMLRRPRMMREMPNMPAVRGVAEMMADMAGDAVITRGAVATEIMLQPRLRHHIQARRRASAFLIAVVQPALHIAHLIAVIHRRFFFVIVVIIVRFCQQHWHGVDAVVCKRGAGDAAAYGQDSEGQTKRNEISGIGFHGADLSESRRYLTLAVLWLSRRITESSVLLFCLDFIA
jgi:hypothetical protein